MQHEAITNAISVLCLAAIQICFAQNGPEGVLRPRNPLLVSRSPNQSTPWQPWPRRFQYRNSNRIRAQQPNPFLTQAGFQPQKFPSQFIPQSGSRTNRQQIAGFQPNQRSLVQQQPTSGSRVANQPVLIQRPDGSRVWVFPDQKRAQQIQASLPQQSSSPNTRGRVLQLQTQSQSSSDSQPPRPVIPGRQTFPRQSLFVPSNFPTGPSTANSFTDGRFVRGGGSSQSTDRRGNTGARVIRPTRPDPADSPNQIVSRPKSNPQPSRTSEPQQEAALPPKIIVPDRSNAQGRTDGRVIIRPEAQVVPRPRPRPTPRPSPRQPTRTNNVQRTKSDQGTQSAPEQAPVIRKIIVTAPPITNREVRRPTPKRPQPQRGTRKPRPEQPQRNKNLRRGNERPIILTNQHGQQVQVPPQALFPGAVPQGLQAISSGQQRGQGTSQKVSVSGSVQNRVPWKSAYTFQQTRNNRGAFSENFCDFRTYPDDKLQQYSLQRVEYFVGNTSCSPFFFECAVGQTFLKNCSSINQVFDISTVNCNFRYNVRACPEYDNHLHCTVRETCAVNEFACCASPQKCISLAKRCDGISDCSDGEDEVNCPSCQGDEFPCVKSERCIPVSQRCDGIPDDCHDQSNTDEADCGSCSPGQFHCYRSRGNPASVCLDQSTRCDGNPDCPSGEDELNCKSKGHKYLLCENQQQSVPKTEWCDGVENCLDGSDEFYCSVG